MSREHTTIWCDGCGVEILWLPIEEADRDYCCEDCRQGLACECSDRMEEEERRAPVGALSVVGGPAGL
jgi:hypothetical protein